MIKYYYGVRNTSDLMAILMHVTEIFPASNPDNTMRMLWGTLCAETLAGTFRDKTPEKAGVGIGQIDEIAFKDVKARTKDSVKETVKHEFEIDINKVKHKDLARNPLLSIIFTRLFYMLVPEPFPDTHEGRAQYWKDHYNKTGKGSPEQYLERLQTVNDLIKDKVQWAQ